MGTRADFYVGRGESAEWIGSCGWDGYPSGLESELLHARDLVEFRYQVAERLKDDDGTTPDLGWPWPWDNSGTTDYAYAFDGGQVWMSHYGTDWLPASQPEPEEDWPEGEPAVLPDMSARKRVTMGSRSGVMVIGAK